MIKYLLALLFISASAYADQMEALQANQGRACVYSNPWQYADVPPSVSMPVPLPSMGYFIGAPKRVEPRGCHDFIHPSHGGITNAPYISNGDYAIRVVLEADLANDVTVVVNRRCASACANEITRLIPKGLKVCMTPQASFAYHPTLHREIDLKKDGYQNVHVSQYDTDMVMKEFPIEIRHWLIEFGVMDVSKNPTGERFLSLGSTFFFAYGFAHPCTDYELHMAELEIGQFERR